MLVYGSRSGVVTKEDKAAFLRHQPSTRIEAVDGAGHAVQSDRPVRLAELIKNFMGPAASVRPDLRRDASLVAAALAGLAQRAAQDGIGFHDLLALATLNLGSWRPG